MILGFIQKLEMFSRCLEHKYGSKYVEVKKNKGHNVPDWHRNFLSVRVVTEHF